MTEDTFVICYTPTDGKDGGVNIPRWKYDVVRNAILNALDSSEAGRVRFKDLPETVEAYLTPNQLAKLGSLTWHVTTVKLNMEVDGEIKRLPGCRPQTLSKGE